MAQAPTSRSEHEATRLTLILLLAAILIPVLVLITRPSAILFWLALLAMLVLWALAFRILSSARVATPDLHMVSLDEQPRFIRDVMDVRVATEQEGVKIFRGPLRAAPEVAYRSIAVAAGDALIPLLHEDDKLGARIVLVPKPAELAVETRVQPWKHWMLFALTFLTTTWAGAMHAGANVFAEPERIWMGLPYSIGLLSILGLHELGHYFAARRHGMNVTPPYFIPVPFALGTFGAFIRMKSPPVNRRALFDMAVAGPLAGLVVAVPALFIGLQGSQIITVSANEASAPAGTSAGASMLLVLIAQAALGGDFAPDTVLRLSPLAFAGWLGLFVTALNLLPVGQLDGGHIARAMFGHRIGNLISTIAIWSLVLLAMFVWPGLVFWVVIILLLARRGTPPLNDLTPIGRGRLALGCVTFGILLMILAPMPASLWRAAAAGCPYL